MSVTTFLAEEQLSDVVKVEIFYLIVAILQAHDILWKGKQQLTLALAGKFTMAGRTFLQFVQTFVW